MSSLSPLRPLHVFQIVYSAEHERDPGFEALDNSSNERPDWYEYWPIRKFLLSQSLDEKAFYGFLSPQFQHKTNLTAAMVRDFAAATDHDTEVILMSPSMHNAAYYLSVFEHGEAQHRGLLSVASRLLARLHGPVDLREFISDSRNSVHSNYFLAKPRFWRAWLALSEGLFAIAEDASDPLGADLRAPTTYRGRNDAHMKIFVMERLATWILVSDPSFVTRVRDPFAARARFYKLPVAIVCDALKMAYATQRRGQYKEMFLMVRNLQKLLNMQIRVGDSLGWRRVRPHLLNLKSYWRR